MDLADYRSTASEKDRIADLLAMIPPRGGTALDVGARDGFISKLLVNHFSKVVALDLTQPDIDHDRVTCVQGDITGLEFVNGSFDLVFCAEVLEHIPTHLLGTACQELARVSKDYLLIGVPYKQDIRLGRTTCASCGKYNPPWGHVNRFDEKSLTKLFPGLRVVKQSFVGVESAQTNGLSCALMDLAGNPYGTYVQDEPCIHCGGKIGEPRERSLWQKVLTKVAFIALGLQKPFLKPHANWIHLLLQKQ